MKLTGLWWWIDRWRKSTAYTGMTLEEQGAYRNLLDECRLLGGTLPQDEVALGAACGDASAWPRVRSAVMDHFELRDGGWVPVDEITSPAPLPPSTGRRHRPHIPLWIQRFVRSRDGCCRLCGSLEQPELDHIIRKRDGGKDTPENLRVLCRPCNRRRG